MFGHLLERDESVNLNLLPSTVPSFFFRTQRLHAVLAELIRLCPKGIKEILPIMQKSFPFRLRPKAELIWAYRQAFAVVEYVPDIYKDFMQFVIDKCLEMDVEIKIVDGGNVALQNEESAPAAQDTVFELEEDEKRAREQQQVQKDTRQRTRANHVAANDMADKVRWSDVLDSDSETLPVLICFTFCTYFAHSIYRDHFSWMRSCF